MKKNAFCLVLALVLCLTGLYVPVLAADDTCAVTYQGDVTVRPAVIDNGMNIAVIHLTATDANKKLPAAVSVQMGGRTLAAEEYVYDKGAGTVTIYTQIIDDIVISGAYPVIVSSTCDGITNRETIAYVDANTEYRFVLKAPNGFVLPESVNVRVGGKSVKMDEDKTYYYDSESGEVTLAKGVVTGELTVKVHYPAGTLIVNNTVIYRYGELQDYSGKGLSFQPKTQTLILDNAKITQPYTGRRGAEYGIYTNMDHLTIALKGNSTIAMPAPKGNKSYGIYAEGDLSIVSLDEERMGTLTITTADVQKNSGYAQTFGVFASMASDHFLIDGVVLDIQAGQAFSMDAGAQSYGIYIDYCFEEYSGMQIRNSNVTVKGGNATGSTGAYSAGIFAGDQAEDHITITNSTVFAGGGSAVAVKSASSYGVSCAGDMRILENSALTARAGQVESGSKTAIAYGLFCTAKMSVCDAQVDTVAEGAFSFGDDDGASVGTFVKDLKLEYAELRSQGADHALIGYGAMEFSKGAGAWYQWKTEPNDAYTLSSVKDFKQEREKTYLHIMPANEKLPAGQFYDVHPVQHWAADAVDTMVQHGLMNGYEDRTFKPEATATRSQIITILWRMDGAPTFGQGKSGTFVDVPEGTWYTQAVEWAAANGITDGKGDGTFGPNDKITREQPAVMLYHYEQYKGGGFSGMWMFLLDYEDRADVSEWAYEAMCWMTMNKVINGSADGTLNPKGIATRAEVAQVLTNYLKLKD